MQDYLQALVDEGASDLHLKVGHPPVLRVSGNLEVTDFAALDADDMRRLAEEIVPDDEFASLDVTGGADFAYMVDGIGRFRVNVFKQRGLIGMVMRYVLPAPPVIDALHLPDVISRLAAEPRGLILVCGPTGSGKTTTCAAIINHINTHRAVNIVTLEDPIEMMHPDKRSLVNQREVGTDTASWSQGLRHAMRQDPDVIFIGEMRDPDTVWAALAAAETGHLVISTLHTIDSMETVNRIVEFFPEERHKQVRHSLAGALRGIISQRLVPRADDQGQVPAVEVCVNTGRIHEAIVDPEETRTIPDIIAEGDYYGMRTFDQALMEMYESGTVALDDALSAATNAHDLRLALRKAGVA